MISFCFVFYALVVIRNFGIFFIGNINDNDIEQQDHIA